MDNRINTSQDGADYDSDPYWPDRITDANNLHDAWLAAQKGSSWKTKVQMYEIKWLFNNAKLASEIRNRTYKPQEPSEFIFYERGKERLIHGEQVPDRVVEHSLNDNVIIPAITPFLIYDNGASLKGKGTSFTRRRLIEMLVRHYNQFGNDGWLLLMDDKKFYDNIRHDILMNLYCQYIHDPTALWIIEGYLKSFEVDVSYMSEEEFNHCLENVFNSMEHRKIPKELLTGEKIMAKHLDIGNQTSQSSGTLYPAPIDNYIKIRKSVKMYLRYQDDSLAGHQSKAFLEDLYAELIPLAKEHGLILNEKKTRIVKMSDYWRFLQIQYSLTSSGRIVQKINPKQIAVQRRKMKKLAPIMTFTEFTNWHKSWIRSHRKYMSKLQYQNMTQLYHDLKGLTQHD